MNYVAYIGVFFFTVFIHYVYWVCSEWLVEGRCLSCELCSHLVANTRVSESYTCNPYSHHLLNFEGKQTYPQGELVC